MKAQSVNTMGLEDHFLRNFQESAHYIFGAWGSQDGIWDWDLIENQVLLLALLEENFRLRTGRNWLHTRGMV